LSSCRSAFGSISCGAAGVGSGGGDAAQLGGVDQLKQWCRFALVLTRLTPFLQCVAQAENAEELEPPKSEADADIKQAEEQRWQDKHGETPEVRTGLVRQRNCTSTVPVLPPRYTRSAHF
jgi:hypothetical protein